MHPDTPGSFQRGPSLSSRSLPTYSYRSRSSLYPTGSVCKNLPNLRKKISREVEIQDGALMESHSNVSGRGQGAVTEFNVVPSVVGLPEPRPIAGLGKRVKPGYRHQSIQLAVCIEVKRLAVPWLQMTDTP
jgi:hypothetical protein